MEQEVTSFKDLGEIIRNAPEFKLDRFHTTETRLGELSIESLKAEYGGNKEIIDWLSVGRFEGWKGFRDEFLHGISGLKEGKIKSDYHYHDPTSEIQEMRKIALVARKKYLSQMKI